MAVTPAGPSLLLKRAALSRPSGQWDDDDYDVLADGEVVGRIYKAHAAPGRLTLDVDSSLLASRARLRWRRSLRAGDRNRAAAPLARPLARAAGAPGIRNSCYAKGKSPAFRPEAGLKGYLRHSAEGFPPSAPKQFGSRRTGSACQKRKPRSEGDFACGVSLSSQGSASLKGG
jgi:hypothetical protein